MQEIVKTRTFAEFAQEVMENVKRTALDAKALAEDFIITGYLLAEAEETDILKDSDCKSMGEFAKKYYGIDKSTASRFININKRYSVGGNSRQLDPKYSNFGYTKLAEMLTLPEVITEEISPEMTRDEIRAIKNEVAEEKNISDIEVMLEEKDHGVEAEETLIRKVLYQICHEHPDIFKKLWVAVNEIETEAESLQAALAPSGIAMLSCRIPGTGRLMLSVKDIDENLQIINLRSNEKEEFTWEELQQVAVAFLKSAAPNWKVTYRDIYNEEIPEEKTEVAPAQPKAERVVKAKKPETQKKTTKKEPERVEPVAVQEEQLPGQMEAADYPELMPESPMGQVIESITRDAYEVAVNAEPEEIPNNEVESSEERQEEPPKTIMDTFREAAELEKIAIAENDAIRRKFMAFSRGRMPVAELELVREHAEKTLKAINEMISLKKGL